MFLQNVDAKIMKNKHIFDLFPIVGGHKNAGQAPYKTSENTFLDTETFKMSENETIFRNKIVKCF